MTLQQFHPGHEPESVNQLRLRYGTAKETDAPAIHTITMVGAAYGPNHLSVRDLYWLKCAFEYCKHHEISVAEDFRITPLNIRLRDGQEVAYDKEQDFLVNHRPSDLVVVCFVLNPRTKFEFERGGEHYTYAASPHHFEEGAWRNAVLDAGAKVVVSFEYYKWTRPSSEIGAHMFSRNRGVQDFDPCCDYTPFRLGAVQGLRIIVDGETKVFRMTGLIHEKLTAGLPAKVPSFEMPAFHVTNKPA